MEAALAAQEDGDADGAAADDMSDVSSVVSGLSAYTQHSAAATSGPTSTGTFAPSTVGGRRPQRRRQKVWAPTLYLPRNSFLTGQRQAGTGCEPDIYCEVGDAT